jgi:hypothetical protein
MLRIANLGRYLAIAGFVLGAIAWIWAAFGGDRESAVLAFAWCFIAAVVGIVLAIVFTPAERFGNISPLGMKIGAIGFAIAAIPTAVGGFLLGRSDEELNSFFWTGGAIFVTGILIQVWSVFKRERGGS